MPTKNFLAIEGLRGLLAWIVVASHLTWLSGFQSHLLRDCGGTAVMTFIIISGFVITHTILQKQEGYWPYIVRRFFRIFPLFAVTCIVGYFTSDLLAASALSDQEFMATVDRVASSDHENWLAHTLTHLLMIHAAIPDSLLSEAEYAFNMPAWSISLEWQFYLFAPLIVFVLRHKRQWLIPFAILVAIGETVSYRGTHQSGALPLMAYYFATGIFCRLIYTEKMARPPAFLFTVALAIVFFPIKIFQPFAIWAVVFMGLSHRATDWLKHPLALYFGSRSYSTYLCHYPILSGVAWALQPASLLTLALVGTPLIIAVSELAYRWIEQPGIAAGRRLAKIIASKPLTADGKTARPPITATE